MATTNGPRDFNDIAKENAHKDSNKTPAGSNKNGPTDYNSMMSGNEKPDVIRDMNGQENRGQSPI